jgi:predicted nucleic acid-binding Zn ribbon protein
MARPKTKCADCGKDSKGYVYCEDCEKAHIRPIEVPAVHLKGNGWASKDK